MTLCVRQYGDDLHLPILGALEDLCPEAEFQVDGSGLVTKSATQGCGSYCTHRVGCNLVDDLMTATEKITIALTGAGHAYSKLSAANNPGTVLWNPTGDYLATNQCGGARVSSSVALGHELVHALQDIQGTLETGQKEIVASRGENQVRAELCELLRVRYGAKQPIPDFDVGWLDAEDRLGCVCSGRMPVLDQALREFRCRLIQVLRCALGRLTGDVVKVPDQPMWDVEAMRALVRPLGGFIRDEVEVALETRAASPQAWMIAERARQSLHRDPFTLLCENVAIAGAYTGLLVHPVDDREVRIVTNLSFTSRREGFVSGPLGLTERTVERPEWLDERLRSVDYEARVVPDEDIVGGTVTFLTTRITPADTVRALLVGCSYPAFLPGAQPPRDQPEGEWAATETVYEIARDLLSDGPRRMRVLSVRR